jgi:hypothetical protein
VGPDPLAGDDVGAWRPGHQLPCLVGEERGLLLFHRAVPVGVQQGIMDGRGYWGDRCVAGQCRKGPGRQCAGRVPCHHRVNMTWVAVKQRRVVDRRCNTS